MADTTYVLYCDDHGCSGYFIRVGLGIFWECGRFEDAKHFPTRAAAARVMHRAGKHRQGWRVLASDQCVSQQLNHAHMLATDVASHTTEPEHMAEIGAAIRAARKALNAKHADTQRA